MSLEQEGSLSTCQRALIRFVVSVEDVDTLRQGLRPAGQVPDAHVVEVEKLADDVRVDNHDVRALSVSCRNQTSYRAREVVLESHRVAFVFPMATTSLLLHGASAPVAWPAGLRP